MNDAAIRLRNVTFSYPGDETPTLKDVSLDIPAGQCIVITGSSGCGKTTLTRLMNGLIPHVYPGELEGSVEIGGRSVSDWRSGDLGTTVGSVFQNPRSQFVNLDTTSEIAFGCENLGMERERIVRRISDTAAALEIGHLLGRSVEELSGGQKQIVIAASAYAMQPDYYVLDEPTASLDVCAMRRLAHAIDALKRKGKTVVISEHRLWWLSDVADRVILLDEGRIAGDWNAKEFGALEPERRVAYGMRAWHPAEMVGDAFAALRRPVGSENDPALRVEGVTVGYRKRRSVLHDAAFAAHRGRVSAIIGDNGVGKTTMLRCLAGLTRESVGDIVLNGTALPFRKRPSSVHLVMQEPGYQLFSDTVRGELERAAALSLSGRRLRGEAAASAVEEALARFGLSELSDRHPLSLSGGERQRLAIAAGILQGARVLLLDEPTSGLDRRNMERVADALREVAADGATVCVVTHDFEFLNRACDDIIEFAGDGIRPARYLDASTLKRVYDDFGFHADPSDI